MRSSRTGSNVLYYNNSNNNHNHHHHQRNNEENETSLGGLSIIEENYTNEDVDIERDMLSELVRWTNEASILEEQENERRRSLEKEKPQTIIDRLSQPKSQYEIVDPDLTFHPHITPKSKKMVSTRSDSKLSKENSTTNFTSPTHSALRMMLTDSDPGTPFSHSPQVSKESKKLAESARARMTVSDGNTTTPFYARMTTSANTKTGNSPIFEQLQETPTPPKKITPHESMDLTKRLFEWHQKTSKKINSQKELKTTKELEDEMKECTFKPNISTYKKPSTPPVVITNTNPSYSTLMKGKIKFSTHSPKTSDLTQSQIPRVQQSNTNMQQTNESLFQSMDEKQTENINENSNMQESYNHNITTNSSYQTLSPNSEENASKNNNNSNKNENTTSTHPPYQTPPLEHNANSNTKITPKTLATSANTPNSPQDKNTANIVHSSKSGEGLHNLFSHYDDDDDEEDEESPSSSPIPHPSPILPQRSPTPNQSFTNNNNYYTQTHINNPNQPFYSQTNHPAANPFFNHPSHPTNTAGHHKAQPIAHPPTQKITMQTPRSPSNSYSSRLKYSK